MKFDWCAHAQQRIDELLVDGSSMKEDQALCEHLESCAVCQEHLTACNRVISGLAGISFNLEPALSATVKASLAARTLQLESSSITLHRVIPACVVALAFSALGSLFDLQFDGLIATLLDIQRAQARQGVIHFWILPTLFFLLLFPILPLLSRAEQKRPERTSK